MINYAVWWWRPTTISLRQVSGWLTSRNDCFSLSHRTINEKMYVGSLFTCVHFSLRMFQLLNYTIRQNGNFQLKVRCVSVILIRLIAAIQVCRKLKKSGQFALDRCGRWMLKSSSEWNIVEFGEIKKNFEDAGLSQDWQTRNNFGLFVIFDQGWWAFFV